MIVEKIHYEELFPTGQFANIRLRAEGSVDCTDDKTECFKSLQTLVRTAFQAIAPEEMMGTVIRPTVEDSTDKRIDVLIQDINDCNVLDEKNSLGVQVGLLGFEKMASSHPELKAAYDLKLKQFQP